MACGWRAEPSTYSPTRFSLPEPPWLGCPQPGAAVSSSPLLALFYTPALQP